MDKAQLINAFWNSFNLKAYDENTVPDDAELPYITYNVSTDSIGYNNFISASLWYRSTSWKEITEKADEISEYISLGGKLIDFENGKAFITKSTPFAQRMSEPSDDSIRRILLNISVEFISAE